MSESGALPRDVSTLRIPMVGTVGLSQLGAWEVLGADGEPVAAWVSFRAELVAAGCSGSTCRSYAYDVLRWLRFLVAVEIPWQRADRVEVRDFVRWLRTADNPARARNPAAHGRPPVGSLNPATGKPYLSEGYAPRTINHALSVLSEFYRHAVDHDLGPLRNPVPSRGGRGVRGRVGPERRSAGYRQREPRAQPRGLTEDLVQQVFASLSQDRDRALVSVALTSGARAGELLSMTRGGIEVGRGLVSVVPKGAPGRVWIPVAPEALVWLGRYLATQPGASAAAPVWMTLRSPQRPLTYFALRQVLARVNTRLGSNVTWHDLRHTFSHRLLADDQMAITDVQALLRHRSLSTLTDYAAVRVDELVERLQRHLARPTPPPVPALGYNSADLQVLFPGMPL